MESKGKVNEWVNVKIKSFCKAKVTPQNKKTINQMGDDICKQKLQQGVNIQIYKELIHFNTKQIIQLKNGQRT